MSFQNKGFWMPKADECLADGEMPYDDNSSRIEPKRSHQWFMDGTEADLFPNKKQVLEVPNSHSFPGISNLNLSPWGNASCFHPVSGPQFTERLFESETTRTLNFDDRNIPSVTTRNLNIEDPFGTDSSFGLSISQSLEDSRSGLNYGGIRKVKVSQVKDADLSAPMGQVYTREDDNPISMGLGYNRVEDDGIISVGDIYNREDNNNNFISMGGQTYNKVENHENLLMGHAFNKVDNNNTMTMGGTYKGGSSIISFGGSYDDHDTDASGRLLCSYDLLMGQPLVQTSDSFNERGLVETSADVVLNSAQLIASGSENVARKKEDQTSKKVSPNNFPSNVRSLLSTGMMDGVAVKYLAWSREELRGIIKGTGYLCGCQACNFSKVINAYEFERHAGCKTKHPNNHIYFENGKTIYGVVQELRSTPQNVLFEVIQTITGSPINQKSFRLWKESFLAATRELQRIYGKDDAKQFS